MQEGGKSGGARRGWMKELHRVPRIEDEAVVELG
jgi:hypothetical protein